MIVYLLKMIVCSGLLLAGYELLLAKEAMHRFKRFYLLCSLLLSLIVPLLTIEVAEPVIISPAQQFILPEMREPLPLPTINEVHPEGNNATYLQYALLLPSLLLLGRFIKNIADLLHLTKQCQIIPIQGAKLVLINQPTIAYSFLNYIFINKQDYQDGLIEEQILEHEIAHVRQKHTLDIVLLEIVFIAFWFNPFLFFYRKAIRLNHEFLADSEVIKAFQDTTAYQHLLLNKINTQTSHSTITSPFYFLTAKKRIMMMSKITSPKQMFLSKFATILLLPISVFIFSNYVTAQTEGNNQIIANKDKGISLELFNEYETALIKAEVSAPNFNGRKIKAHKIEKVDRHRMDFLYYSMSPEQKRQVTNVGFIPTPLPPEKKSPTQEQIKEWASSGQYRIWKDGERLSRAALKGFRPSDFVHYRLVKVQPNSVDYENFKYYVDVMTPGYYDACYVKKTQWNLRISRGELQYCIERK